jgi:tetratricopeptide (TPR) repeat protein
MFDTGLSMINSERKIKIYTIAAFVVTGILITFPLRSLVADYNFHFATSILRDPGSNKGRALPVSDKTMMAYFEAIRSLEVAAAIAPPKSQYFGSLAEVHTRMGRWAAAMELMHAQLPDGSMNSREAYQRAEDYLKAAIRSDPSNPDHHFALGYLYDIADKDSGQAEKELSKAIAAYPINASLRYAVANEHLRVGRKGDAIEQAGMLARIIDNNTPGNYLVSAFEIAWRATGNPEVVKGICPDEPWARQAAKKFLKLKGIKE